MEPMNTAAISVPFGHHSAHVVVQNLARHPAEAVKRILVAADQRLDLLVVAELDIRRTAPAQRRNEHFELVAPLANRRPVSLHLMARLGLEANDRFRRQGRPQALDKIFKPRRTARITAFLDLPQ